MFISTEKKTLALIHEKQHATEFRNSKYCRFRFI